MGVKAYAERLLPLAKAIRERWPQITLYACTFWEAEDAKLLERVGETIDLISYHLYDDPNNYATGPANFEAVWTRYRDIIGSSPNRG